MVPTWSETTELLTLVLTLRSDRETDLPNQYTTALHGWFLDQMRGVDPALSQYLHDEQAEKAFTLSPIFGLVQSADLRWRMVAGQEYQVRVSALSKRVCQGFANWMIAPPKRMSIARQTFEIVGFAVEGAIAYQTLWNEMEKCDDELALTFVTATSFRKRGNHMPLPIPENVFHSYLRRWNVFGPIAFEGDHFLNWVNDCVVILRHEIRSLKVQAGKRGSVTGFMGAVQFGLVGAARKKPEYVQLVKTLVRCAPYFGTGHKGTFGLGQTRIGGNVERGNVELRIENVELSGETGRNAGEKLVRDRKEAIAVRAADLEDLFFAAKKRQGGDRARLAARTWAVIMARYELGDSLKAIAADLGMNYETVKRYAKLARKAMRTESGKAER